MPHLQRSVVALVLAGLVVTACSTQGPAAGGSASPAAAELDGRAFLAASATGRTLVPGATVRLAFEDGAVSGSGGCNTMGGTYAVDGERLRIAFTMMTEMACDEPRMAQDAWLSAFVADVTWALDGPELRLEADGVVLVLADREVADPDRPLLGTRWVVDGIVSGGTVSSVPRGASAALVFGEGSVAVEAGCNTGSATLRVGDGSLALGPLGLTKMACEPARMELERAVASILGSGTVAYAIEARSLTLTGAAGGLILVAAD